MSRAESQFIELIPGTSYIDLFCLTNDPQYALTLEVKDDVLGMDVLGDTLVVLVQRDIGGVLPEHRMYWYDVSTVEPTSCGGTP